MHHYTGAVTRDLTEDTTLEQYGPVLSQPQRKHPGSFEPAL